MPARTSHVLLAAVVPAVAIPSRADTAAMRVVIDADTANGIDDLYAIVRALIAPEMRIDGLSSTRRRSGDRDRGLAQSQTISEQLLDRMNLRDPIPQPRGADWPVPDRTMPVDSPAARHTIERARAAGSGRRPSLGSRRTSGIREK